MMKPTIEHDAAKKYFFVHTNGLTSKLSYEMIGTTAVDYYSTFVPTELRGQGIAGALAEHALQYAEQSNLKVRPSCSYVKTYIERHPEYQHLLL